MYWAWQLCRGRQIGKASWDRFLVSIWASQATNLTIKELLGWILMILALLMAIGAVETRFLMPETSDGWDKNKTLEVPVRGRMN